MFSAIKLFVFLSIVTGFIYPVVVNSLSQIFFAKQASGNLIFDKNNKCIGSRILGQKYTSDKYFKCRPSRAGSGYDTLYSGGSNLGPTSSKLFKGQKDFDGVEQLSNKYRLENNIDANAAIPIDAVTASGSGLDPDISIENALLQARRVARARNVSEDIVLQLIKKNIIEPQFRLLGEQRLNVNDLNIALDKL